MHVQLLYVNFYNNNTIIAEFVSIYIHELKYYSEAESSISNLTMALYGLLVACVHVLLVFQQKRTVLGQQVPGPDNTAQTSIPLYFSLILSYGEFGFNSSGEVPAVDIALEQIYYADILPGYRLQYQSVKNSKVRLRVLYH